MEIFGLVYAGGFLVAWVFLTYFDKGIWWDSFVIALVWPISALGFGVMVLANSFYNFNERRRHRKMYPEE